MRSIDGALLGLRCRKLWWLLRRPGSWPLLRVGIAPSLEHDGLLAGRRFQSLIDIGANRGQFTVWAAAALGVEHVVCVDPLPDADTYLTKVAAYLHPRRVSIINAALGSARSRQTLHVTAASDSSSLLPVAPVPELPLALREIGRHEVDVFAGDDVLTGPFDRPLLVKIDVQGSELDVLAGLGHVLAHADAILVEVSFGDFYCGQSDASAVIRSLFDAGFTLAGVARVPGSSSVWDLDQADLLFERRQS